MARRGNDLNGSDWTRLSVSIWNDIRKSSGELKLRHPAMFPSALAERLLACFTTSSDRAVLDPFMGSGSTLVAAAAAGKTGIGLEISEDYIALARDRLAQANLFRKTPDARIVKADARTLKQHVEAQSVSLCVTSPPYWDILTRRRTADGKAPRDYGDTTSDLGRIARYEAFLEELTSVFVAVLHVLVPGKYCVVNVMYLRKKGKFYPLHADLARRLADIGWIFDDLIIWDRRHECHNLRPLGYPSVFRINKVHEYLLVFRKPTAPASP